MFHITRRNPGLDLACMTEISFMVCILSITLLFLRGSLESGECFWMDLHMGRELFLPCPYSRSLRRTTPAVHRSALPWSARRGGTCTSYISNSCTCTPAVLYLLRSTGRAIGYRGNIVYAFAPSQTCEPNLDNTRPRSCSDDSWWCLCSHHLFETFLK